LYLEYKAWSFKEKMKESFSSAGKVNTWNRIYAGMSIGFLFMAIILQETLWFYFAVSMFLAMIFLVFVNDYRSGRHVGFYREQYRKRGMWYVREREEKGIDKQ